MARAADAKPIDIAAGQTVRNISITVPRVETGSILVEEVPARNSPRDLLYAMTDIYLAPDGELQKAIPMQQTRCVVWRSVREKPQPLRSSDGWCRRPRSFASILPPDGP